MDASKNVPSKPPDPKWMFWHSHKFQLRVATMLDSDPYKQAM
jgi:hypothetical protein